MPASVLSFPGAIRRPLPREQLRRRLERTGNLGATAEGGRIRVDLPRSAESFDLTPEQARVLGDALLALADTAEEQERRRGG